MKSLIDRIDEAFNSSPMDGVSILDRDDWTRIKSALSRLPKEISGHCPNCGERVSVVVTSVDPITKSE